MGTLYLSNGDSFVGKFSFDYVHVKGTYIASQGETVVGEWSVNRLVAYYP